MISGVNRVIINASDLRQVTTKTKKTLTESSDVKAVKEKLAQGVSVKDLTKEESKTLKKHLEAESALALYQSYKEDYDAKQESYTAERIATKIAKGEYLTPTEERLMNEKYPDLKRDALQARREAAIYKETMKRARTDAEKNNATCIAFTHVGALMKKGTISAKQGELRIIALQKAQLEAKREKRGYQSSNTGWIPIDYSLSLLIDKKV